jgi:hypothetical protein
MVWAVQVLKANIQETRIVWKKPDLFKDQLLEKVEGPSASKLDLG